jgi:exopolysaccharide production protein ExoY
LRRILGLEVICFEVIVLSATNFQPVASVRLERSARSLRLRIPDSIERSAGLLLLALTAPVSIACGAAVAILSRRSPLVAHLRVGKDDRSFWMFKLRTMWDKPDTGPWSWVEYVIAEPATDAKPVADSRVTSRLASFLRKRSIDELPQLWNVVRGDMALVGPRPLTRGEVVRHYGASANELLSVKPGLTGLWQVSGRSHIKFPLRAMMDLKLVRSLSAKMYVAILMQTVVALVTGNGAW